MKAFIQPGEVITVAAPYDRLSGEMAKVGSIIGVAQGDGLTGVDVELVRRGVFDLAKVSAQAWAIGDNIYWDDAARLCTTVSTANTLVGVATDVAANPTPTGNVLLDGAVR